MAGFDEKKCEKELMARAGRYLSKKGSALPDKGVNASLASLLGKPTQTILRYAEGNSVSLIAS